MYDYDRTAVIRWNETPDQYSVSGDYNDLRNYLKKLKNQGWQWDPQRKVWSIFKARLTPRQVSTIMKTLGLGEKKKVDPSKAAGVLQGLKPYGAFMATPHAWYIPDVGVDLRPSGAELTPRGWLFGVASNDADFLVKVAPKLKSGLERRQKRLDQVLKNLQALKSFNGVSWNQESLVLDSPLTFYFKENLKAMGFRYKNQAWVIAPSNLDPADASKLTGLFEGAREQAEKDAERKRDLRVERQKQPPSDKQLAFLERLIAKYRNGWYDATDGIRGMTPPTPGQLRRMPRGEVEGLIQLLLDNE